MASSTLRCQRCGERVLPEDRFCMQCGVTLVAGPAPVAAGRPGDPMASLARAERLNQPDTPATHCPTCHAAVLTGDLYCPSCGGALAVPEPAAAPARAEDTMWDEVLRRLRSATIGEYEIAGKLGSGGMAAVFLAHEIALNRKVAIKVMAPSFLVDSGLVDRFKQEARTVAAMRHPNIVNIHAVREVDHLHFFVMQFIAGRSLSEVVKEDGRLPIPVVQTILFQVASALGYAHRRGVVHRDIKPANIMLDDEGNAIVTDFGIAKVTESPGLTMTGGTVGTPTYMSPEQCNAAALTGASDQYSLGIVAYELLTGAPPFTGPAYAIMGAHVRDVPDPVERLRLECPAPLAGAVSRMLAKRPEDRFSNTNAAAVAAGGKPLTDDDPLRAELARMAARVLPRTVQLHAVTPPSLLPRPSRESGISLSLRLAPVPDPLPVGQRLQLRVEAAASTGDPLPLPPLQWSSDAPAIVSVSPDGTVQAHAPGSATITAACYGVTATSLVRVRGAPAAVTPPASRSASPEAPTRAQPARQAAPAPVSPPAIGRKPRLSFLRWALGATALVVIVVLLVWLWPKGGDTPAVARRITLSASAETLTVGADRTLRAEVRDADDRVLPQAAIDWSSDAPDVVSVAGDRGTATLRGVRAGQTRIQARSGALSATADIVVRGAGRGLALTVPRRELPVGDSMRILADGRPGTDGGVRFASNRPDVLRVAPDGMAYGVAAGSAEVLGTRGADSGRVVVSVRGAPAGPLAIEPPSMELQVGQAVRLELVGLRGGGSVTWSVSDPGRARVRASGATQATVTALSPGQVEIVATAGRSRASSVVKIAGASFLEVSPDRVAFQFSAGAAVPPPQAVTIGWGGADRPLVGSPDYTPAGGSWITTALQGSTLTLRLAAEAGALAPGQYGARIPVSAGTIKHEIAVTLTVSERAGGAGGGGAAGPTDLTAAKAEIQQLLDEYAAAINAGDSAAILRIYPSITKRGMQDLMDIAKNRGSAAYDLRLRGALRAGETPGTAQGEVVALFLGGRRSGGITNIYLFARQERRWIISGWKPLK